MRFTRLLLPCAALALASGLLVSTDTSAFTTNGEVLDIPVRDFRVFNNFSHAETNDNTTPEPQFPGHSGAVLAIWKASVEWGSRLHGDGGGDPSQPADLGSGGANFDAAFGGLAPGVGSLNDNVHSEISGMPGGVIAFVESPTSDGWRIRYNAAFCFDDGPGLTSSPQCIDLQGLATYLYGGALGLGHSTVAAATMFPVLSGTGISTRSLHADDIAGVQAIYGVAAANKPIVQGVTLLAGVVTVSGANFTATGNEVWFTGVKLSGLSASAGGTQISVPLPAGAQPGDVLVKSGITGHRSLSNAWPFDPAGAGCPPPGRYCSSAANSVGPGALISWSGSTSVAANNLRLSASSCPSNQFGLFYYGANAAQLPFGDGFRCVAGSLFRLPVVMTDALGDAAHTLDINSPPSGAGQITVGSLWRFQFWYRDPAAGGAGFNLTDALAAVFCL